MNRRSRIAAIALLSLIAAACSGADDDKGSADTTAASATPTSTDGSSSGSTTPGEVRQTLRIGFAYEDVGAFAILSDKFSLGDPELQAQAVLEAWRRDGLLPINGSNPSRRHASRTACACSSGSPSENLSLRIANAPTSS